MLGYAFAALPSVALVYYLPSRSRPLNIPAVASEETCGFRGASPHISTALLQDTLKARAIMEHGMHAAPPHRALLTLSEVLTSTAGPPADGKPPGFQKGRESDLSDWMMQQELLTDAVDKLRRAASLRAAPAAAAAPPRRRLAGLTAGGKGRWWQADALERLRRVRQWQQRFEAKAAVRASSCTFAFSAHLFLWMLCAATGFDRSNWSAASKPTICAVVWLQVHLVGLSVRDTALKLKATGKGDLYQAFVTEFLPDAGAARGGAGARAAKLRYHLDCEVLAQKQQFEALLGKVERVRSPSALSLSDPLSCSQLSPSQLSRPHLSPSQTPLLSSALSFSSLLLSRSQPSCSLILSPPVLFFSALLISPSQPSCSLLLSSPVLSSLLFACSRLFPQSCSPGPCILSLGVALSPCPCLALRLACPTGR